MNGTIATLKNSDFHRNNGEFSGPFQIWANKLRRAKITKGYIFILHVEPVSELTDDACLGALKRFCERRFICKHIYSDNGKNFFMGNRVMNEDMLRAIDESSTRAAIIMANQGVTIGTTH